MQIKKLFKYLPISLMTAGLILAVTVTPPILLKNNQYNEINKSKQSDQPTASDDDQLNPIEYIRNDVIKQTGSPAVIKSIELVESLASSHSAALVTKINDLTILYTWGFNSKGQLGIKNTTNQSTPQPVDFFNGKKINQITLGSDHSAAIADGNLYMWGYNEFGQLGINNTTNQSTPQLVTSLNGKNITQIDLGTNYSAAIADGSLYTWGYNTYGQLGIDNTTHKNTPQLVTSFNGKKINQIILGSSHSAAIADGSLYTWGYNKYGQLGINNTTNQHTPQLVDFFKNRKINQISFGGSYSAALLADGSIYTWGWNIDGQLGINNTADQSTPQLVTSLNGKNITQIALGNAHSAAILDDGSLYMWGFNNSGQLGIGISGSGANRSTPQLVTSFNGKKVNQISLGFSHSAALLADGSFYTWGFNREGQLGLGDSGDGTNRLTPTHMPYLGKDSHITANISLTAQEAVNNIWGTNGFISANFRKSFNLINIPDVSGQQFTMTNVPVSDNSAKTVTMKVGIKYFYNQNGYLASRPIDQSITIAGFKQAIKTNITALPVGSYPKDIIVDKWKDSIMTDGKVDRTKLAVYLQLTDVPPSAEFTITNVIPIYKTGVLTFNITTDKVIDTNDIVIDKPTDFAAFPITLNLTPRITKIENTGFLDDILVSEYYDQVFDETGLINVEEFNKYSTIIAPVADAQYFLVPESYNIHTGDGTVDFKLYASKYYDLDAQEHLGDETDSSTHLDVHLKLNPLPSKVIEKTEIKPTHRVDKFFNTFNNLGDINGTDLDLLKQYIDLDNIPSAATYSIDSIIYDAFNDDFFYEYVNFDLTIDQYNETSFATPAEKIIPLRIKLDAVHLQTKITQKIPTEYDATIRLDRLLPKIINEEGIVVNRPLLEEYVNIEFLPAASVLKIDNIVRTDATGILNFDIIPSIAYGNDSNRLTNEPYPIELALTMRHQPTIIVGNQNLINPERVDRFATKIKSFSNSVDLMNYLTAAPNEPAYLDISGEFPIAIADVNFKVRNVTYTDLGDITFDLIASEAYDSDAEIAYATSFPISLQLTRKYAPTVISLMNVYPQGLSVADFENTMNNSASQTDFKAFLAKFFKGIDTFPETADISWNPIEVNTVSGVVKFTINASTYYDSDSDLQQDFVSEVFTLNLVPEDQMATLTTTIDWKADAPIPTRAKNFYDLVNPNNTVNLVELNNYFVLNNIPVDAEITIVNHDPDFNNDLFLKFDIVITRWWDTGTLKPQNDDTEITKTLSFEKHLFFINTDNKVVSFPWWWVVTAISGIILILIVIFKYREIKQELKFKKDALGTK